MADETFPQEILVTEEPESEEEQAGGVITQEALQAILADQRRANEDLIRRMTQVPQRSGPLQSDSIAPNLEFSLDGLPDPQVDVAGFHKGYAERATKAVQTALGQVRQQAARDAQQMTTDAQIRARADAMVKAANPALTDEVIGLAAGVIANRLRGEGKNPMAELRARTEEIAQEILDYTDDLASQLSGGSPQRTRLADDMQHNGRTRGLVQPRGRAMPRQQTQRAADRDDPQAFFKELTKMQRESRIY